MKFRIFSTQRKPSWKSLASRIRTSTRRDLWSRLSQEQYQKNPRLTKISSSSFSPSLTRIAIPNPALSMSACKGASRENMTLRWSMWKSSLRIKTKTPKSSWRNNTSRVSLSRMVSQATLKMRGLTHQHPSRIRSFLKRTRRSRLS